MKRNLKIAVASVLTAATILSVTACEGSVNPNGEVAGTTTARTTLDTDENVQNAVAELANQVDASIKVEKKIRWLSHYPIDETQAACELFKQVYGIPEEGDESYGVDADMIFDYINVSYADRYDRLATLVQSGDSPDLFQFEIINYPFAAYKGMFQPIDDYLDMSGPEWDATRDVMEQFKWGGKNYCAITSVNLDQQLWYRKSVLADVGITDPYELYKEGNWTWDTFLQMCDDFQQSGEGKYATDGWQIPDKLLLTTGVPFISIDDGKLVSNLYNAEIERGMNDLISVLYREDYRYPRHELNGWGTSMAAWINGDTLFMGDGTWIFGDTIGAYIKRYKWDPADIFAVPFPRDPQSDTYYQSMKIDSFMLCGGAQNTAGFTAWHQCLIAAENDEATHVASREKAMKDFPWTAELYDFLFSELQRGGVFTPVFDFKGGIGQDIVDSNTVYNPVDILVQIPYLNCLDADSNAVTFASLRSSNEGIINSRIEELNASVS